MNQILSTQTNSAKTKSSAVIDINKIIKFFAIILIVLGLVLVVTKLISINSSKEDKVEVLQTEPEVSFTQENNQVVFKVDHDKAILQIAYHWNNEAEIIIEGRNRTSITQDVELPDGTNTLTIKVTDEISSTATITKEFTKEKSEISLSFKLIENNTKIRITATDKQEMDYITYKWNSENEVVVKQDENKEDKNKIEANIDIPKGVNTLTISATNKNGTSTEPISKKVEGVALPEISVFKEFDYLIMNVKDDNGVSLVEFTLNGQSYMIDLTKFDVTYYNSIEGLTVKTNSSNNIVEFEYRQLMTDKGRNDIVITATNKKEAKATYEGFCNNE